MLKYCIEIIFIYRLAGLYLREIGATNERVNDGGSEGIGSIIGLGNGFEAKMNTNHFLDLGFVGHAVAANRAFDLVRAIFVNREMRLFRNQEADAARFGN